MYPVNPIYQMQHTTPSQNCDMNYYSDNSSLILNDCFPNPDYMMMMSLMNHPASNYHQDSFHFSLNGYPSFLPETMSPIDQQQTTGCSTLCRCVSQQSIYLSPATNHHPLPVSPILSMTSSSPSLSNDSSLENDYILQQMLSPPSSPMPNFEFSKINHHDIIIHQEDISKKKKVIEKTVKKQHKNKINVQQQGHFECDYEGCGKVFGRKYNLSSHRITHTAERNYACQVCSKTFVRRHDLKRHARIHTGETPHKCLYCHRGYGRADALQRHYSVHPVCSIKLKQDPLNPFHLRRKRKVHPTGFGVKS
ncbi:uncharacterized protein BX664DRAFT_331040 [Halteromyces radiatus]|uniref:uncharacterized protein n=1 Tax=Halteromyces radiatus TaxID=101107 RepID=UPI00221E4EC7|nr:uncharacterized protein BX664DRAFT_331040 [Halteromyces radiatus]KAI8088660.1 hypothetical protein BX664DRAFT_331040 [Halteromyces radiatus]